MTLGKAYLTCLAHGWELVTATPLIVVVRRGGRCYAPWSVIGFIRLAEALERDRYELPY